MVIKQEYFDLLKRGENACPRYLSFVIGKEYTFESPNNKEKIKAICTQNMPYTLLKT